MRVTVREDFPDFAETDPAQTTVLSVCLALAVAALAAALVKGWRRGIRLSWLLLWMVWAALVTVALVVWAFTFKAGRDTIVANTEDALVKALAVAASSLEAELSTGQRLVERLVHLATQDAASMQVDFAKAWPQPHYALATFMHTLARHTDAMPAEMVYYGGVGGGFTGVKILPAAESAAAGRPPIERHYVGIAADDTTLPPWVICESVDDASEAACAALVAASGCDGPNATLCVRSCHGAVTPSKNGCFAAAFPRLVVTDAVYDWDTREYRHASAPVNVSAHAGVPTETLKFDPRERPWYRTHAAVVWTRPYLFVTGGVGMTVSAGVQSPSGVPMGSLAVDYSLAAMRGLLVGLKATPESVVYLLSTSRYILGSTLSDEALLQDTGLASLEDPYPVSPKHPGRTRDITAALEDRFGTWGAAADSGGAVLHRGGNIVLACAVDVGGAPSQPAAVRLLLVVGVPFDEVMAPASRRAKIALVVACVISLACAAAVFAGIHLVTRPLHTLEEQMEDVAGMELDNTAPEAASWVTDIRSMDTHFRKMVGNLREFRQYLPQSCLVATSSHSLCLVDFDGEDGPQALAELDEDAVLYDTSRSGLYARSRDVHEGAMGGRSVSYATVTTAASVSIDHGPSMHISHDGEHAKSPVTPGLSELRLNAVSSFKLRRGESTVSGGHGSFRRGGANSFTLKNGSFRITADGPRDRVPNVLSDDGSEAHAAEASPVRADRDGSPLVPQRSSSAHHLGKPESGKKKVPSGRLAMSLLASGLRARQVTVSVVNMRGFVPLSQAVPMEELVNTHEQYLQPLLAIAKSTQGVVDEFAGDHVSISHNAVVRVPRHQDLALAMALHIVAKFSSGRGHTAATITGIPLADSSSTLATTPPAGPSVIPPIKSPPSPSPLEGQTPVAPWQIRVNVGISSGAARCGNMGATGVMKKFSIVGRCTSTVRGVERLGAHLDVPVLAEEMVCRELAALYTLAVVGRARIPHCTGGDGAATQAEFMLVNVMDKKSIHVKADEPPAGEHEWMYIMERAVSGCPFYDYNLAVTACYDGDYASAERHLGKVDAEAVGTARVQALRDQMKKWHPDPLPAIPLFPEVPEPLGCSDERLAALEAELEQTKKTLRLLRHEDGKAPERSSSTRRRRKRTPSPPPLEKEESQALDQECSLLSLISPNPEPSPSAPAVVDSPTQSLTLLPPMGEHGEQGSTVRI